MAKSLNQQLYSAFLYGGELAAGTLRLESTSAVTKGLVQVVATQLQLITNSQTGIFVHANTGTRTYTFPDLSGEVLVSGRFTAANQMLYSSAPGTFAILNSIASSVLVSTAGGVPVWAPTGSEGQVLTIVSGAPQFATPPDNGSVGTSLSAENLAYYAVAGNDVSALSTVANRVLLSTAGPTLSWALITAPYLSTTGGFPLTAGVSGQVLTADGSGNFTWTTPPSFVINAGTQFRVPYYSAPGSGQTLSESSWFSLNETNRILELNNQGRIRFYEALANGANYVDFRAPAALSVNTSFVLPSGDGAPGAVLQTDGSGNLSFISLNSGTVNNGTINQLTWYAATGNTVSGLTTIAGRALLSPAGVPSWTLVTAPYLATTGGTPLGNGTLNQVLTSDGSGNFTWTTATTLTGQVLSGVANFLAYYPAGGTAVDDSSFLRINDGGRLLELLDGGQLRFYETTANGANFIQLQAPTALTGNTVYTLPLSDGISGYVLSTDGAGNLSWVFLGHGVVNPGAAGTLAVYTGVNTVDGYGILDDFANVPSRVLLTDGSSVLTWGLISTGYVSTTGGVPLNTGTAGQVLISDGIGNFVWTDISAIAGTIQPGVAGYLTYYPLTGDTVDDSGYLQTDEGLRVLMFHMNGGIRFYDADDSNFIGFVGAANVTTDVTFTLPAADGVAGAVLQTDGAAGLTFEEQVAAGVLEAVARYPLATRRVAPSPNLYNSATGLLATGASFDIEGDDGASPTFLGVLAGDGVGANGADLVLASGASDVLAYGTVKVQTGANVHLSVSELLSVGYVNLHTGVSLRFYDANESNFVAFQAPATVGADVTWTLPNSDGLSGTVLSTDGAGTLSFVTAGHGTVNAGTVANAIAYYTGTLTGDGYGIVDDSQLLLPTGLPVGPGYSFTVNEITGQINYSMLVQPNGINGRLAIYSGAQTVSAAPADTLFYDSGLQTLQLQDNTALSFFEDSSNGVDSVTLIAPAAMPAPYVLTLPVNPAAAPGQVLSSDLSGQLSFITPGSNPDLEKRGSAVISSDAQEVTIIYETPFTSVPATIVAQWVILGSSDPELLPTMGIDVSTPEGFSLRFSNAVPDGTYTINWIAYLTGDTQPASNSNAYMAGGYNGTPLNIIYVMNLDYVPSIVLTPVTWTTARGFGMTSSSSTAGYLMGGDIGGGNSTDVIESYTYTTGIVAAVTATLPTPRSSAGSFGNRTAGYAAGGEELGNGPLLSIDKLLHATEVTSTLVATLTANAIARATAQTSLVAAIVHSNATSTIDLFTIATELVSISATNFGVTNIAVGCNNTYGDAGYFARDGFTTIYKYVFSTDTTSLLTGARSSTVASSASNSMKIGIFTGDSEVDTLDFATETIGLLVNTLPSVGHTSASSPTFQSRGLL